MYKSNISLSFVGMSSTDVTNSAYLLQVDKFNVLLDYGLYQNNDIKKDYYTNKKSSKKLKMKKLNAVIVSHCNIDHIGKLPELYKHGCKCPIYAPEGSLKLMEVLLENSAKILESDADKLRYHHKICAKPLYDIDDVHTCLSYVKEIPYNKSVELSDNIKFEFYTAGHIVSSAQILITVKNKQGLTKRIGYTGDIGSNILHKYYRADRVGLPFCDVLLSESTYCGNTRNHSTKDITNDYQKLRRMFEDVLDKKQGKILIPVFALDRLQKILSFLYENFKDDLKHNIYVDAPLGHKISNVWEDVIGYKHSRYEACNLWQNVCKWDKIKYIDDYKQSLELQRSKEPMIVIATSGMMTQGRSVEWAKRLLPSDKNTICFCGYSSENTLASEIKNKALFVQINKSKVKNNADICVLNSFSSHVCRQELIDYHKETNCNRLYLVHSNLNDRKEFVKILEKEFYNCNKTTRIYIPNFETTIHI